MTSRQLRKEKRTQEQVKKVKKSSFYEFDLDDRKCRVGVELFRKILGIPPRVPNEDFIVPPSKEFMITFLYELGYKGHIDKLASMFVDHMHQPWRTLAVIINKCLSRKTLSNDRLRKSRMDILWGEDFQEYRRAIPNTMLTNDTKQSEAYKVFIGYSIGLIPPKKSRGKGSQGKKPTGRRRPSGVAFKDTLNISKKKSLDRSQKLKGTSITLEAPDESIRKFTTSSEGAGITPEVPDEEKGSSTSKVDATINWGSEDKSERSDNEHVNEGDITWLSINDEEKANEDDEEEDDDRSIDLEETDDERTDSENGDQEMTNAEKIVTEKIDEEKGEEVEHANDDQAQEDQVEDDIVGTLVTMSQKEKPEVPRSSSSRSLSSNYGN
ncbi:hypothetical protein Tco_0237216 [Tanacetum coccineum]